MSILGLEDFGRFADPRPHLISSAWAAGPEFRARGRNVRQGPCDVARHDAVTEGDVGTMQLEPRLAAGWFQSALDALSSFQK